MKRLSTTPAIILMILTAFYWTSCKKNNDPQIPDDEKVKYDNAIDLQENVNTKLIEWFNSMDSIDAVNSALQEFLNDPNVSSAIMGEQGISVQYANGMRGGILLDPKDGEKLGRLNTLNNGEQTKSDENFKSYVNKRKMVLLNPHYSQRSYYTDQMIPMDRSNLNDVNIDFTTYYKGQEATVDRFTELSDYGIIQIYSHGYAWPKETNITDVYLLTGEVANETTTTKYWDELKSGNIPIMKVFGNAQYYFISEDFVEKYNDFSQDTVLFYGGFCYSFLGNWPDINQSFADGAYLGFDWSVFTNYNANWSVNLISLMSDTSKQQPLNLEGWMNNTVLDKSYWNSADDRTVHIYYTGDGTLKLWDKVTIKIETLSNDGTPIAKPGVIGLNYPFKCLVTGGNSQFLKYEWDAGDGSNPITTENDELEISWDQNGEYELSVSVFDSFNDSLIGKAKVIVKIGNEEPPTWNSFVFRLNHLPAVIKKVVQPEGTITYNNWSVDWIYDDEFSFWHSGNYQDGVFSAEWDVTTETGFKKSGSVEFTIDEQTHKITGGSIHAKIQNMNDDDPDDYDLIDININELQATNWNIEDGYFYISNEDLCNTAYILNVYTESYSTLGPVVTYTYTLESYSCDDSSAFYIKFKTE